MDDVKRRLETDLAAARSAIAAGRVEDAQRMIAALSLNVSPGSEFSKEVGDLHFKLGFPAMAGRYWYLLEDKSEEMLAACEEFERSLGNNPVLIFEAIWVADPSPYAKARLRAMGEEVGAFQREFRYKVKPPRGWWDRVACLGCAVVAFVLLFIFAAGIEFIITWF